MQSEAEVPVRDLLVGLPGRLLHSHAMHHSRCTHVNEDQGTAVISHSPVTSGATGIDEAIFHSAIQVGETADDFQARAIRKFKQIIGELAHVQ